MLLATDRLVWCQTLLLANIDDLARAKPKSLRYRFVHTAARAGSDLVISDSLWSVVCRSDNQ